VIKKVGYLVLLMPFPLLADIFNVELGISVNDSNIYSLAENSWEYAYASEIQDSQGDSWASAFYLSGDGRKLYSISDSMKIYLTDFETKTYAKHWSLVRWPYESIEETIVDLFDVYLGKFDASYDTYVSQPIGCVNETPLRYGDIEDDGINELVLFLGGDLVVFSPETNNIVFSNIISTDNWDSPSETVQYFEDFGGEGHADIPQYQWKGVSDLREPVPALRGYGKIYQGDIDEDGNADIVVWRKLYRSYWRKDAENGFEFLSNTFYHFERDLTAQAESAAGITGEYLPQDTPEADIQKWLAENNLTWSKGYPSKSECPGEEGQLILEMHDPLLNDPEVLQ
jgi:hypothetical protein